MENKSDIISKSLPIKNLVEYQDGTVVSRTIINKSAGTVTLFAFDKGESLSEHTAPFDALVIVLDGEAEIIISGQHNTVSEGEMIIMPANNPHAVFAKNKFKMCLTMIKA
ncbi:MAG: cupin domain-containing protein [Chloroherpetonaceae bacterium]|jgi:quercetin dioxygenase-like cupin family protein|nr:cupin domain-containing protein [bacterium]